MEDPFLGQLSPFEVVELQHSFSELGNSTISIFMTALFAYLLISQFIVSKISLGQLFTISIVYSVFLLYQILSLVSIQYNIYNIQLHLIEIANGSKFIVDVESIALTMIMPVICFLGWIVSIIYMRSVWIRK